MSKITPFLWFNQQAEVAVDFYLSVFRNARKGAVAYYPEAASKAAGQPAGSVMTVEFEIKGQKFVALNAGPEFSFTPAISFAVACENQEEIDQLWNALHTGSEIEVCGWVQDKYGVAWQIVPASLQKMISDPDREKVNRVMNAVLQMKKLDLAVLEKAYRGE
ncbi:MAG: VOC family protein [Deltaproteobacteria bacterium]|nr:VOC family protein [Deltaproteobacteria bacterium]